ncbi:MAG: hypothetical protein WCN81_16565 [Actinomycetes bacterium]
MGKIKDGSRTWRFDRESMVREVDRSASSDRICRFEMKPPALVLDAG